MSTPNRLTQTDRILSVKEPPPELISTYRDSFGGTRGFMGESYRPSGIEKRLTPVPPSFSMADNPRLASLESRLSMQERNAQALLDRAMKIKEDVIENLNLTHTTWQGERQQRELLQERLHAITDLINKMDRDIRSVEERVRTRDALISGSGSSVKTLEVQLATALTDVRGRIARCDAAISKLSSDTQSCQTGLKQNNTQNLDNYQRLQDKIQALEVKLAESARKSDWESSNAQSLRSQPDVSLSLSSQISSLETNFTSRLEDLKRKLSTTQQHQESERERAISKLSLALERHEITARDKLDRLEQKLDQAISRMSEDIRGLQTPTNNVAPVTPRDQQDLERRLTAMMETSRRQQNEVLLKLKSEFRQGFSTVHESISSSKQVLEGKLTLGEEQLRKEMAHIRKMVVLV